MARAITGDRWQSQANPRQLLVTHAITCDQEVVDATLSDPRLDQRSQVVNAVAGDPLPDQRGQLVTAIVGDPLPDQRGQVESAIAIDPPPDQRQRLLQPIANMQLKAGWPADRALACS